MKILWIIFFFFFFSSFSIFILYITNTEHIITNLQFHKIMKCNHACYFLSDTFILAYQFNPRRLVSLLTERLLIGPKESNQTNKTIGGFVNQLINFFWPYQVEIKYV